MDSHHNENNPTKQKRALSLGEKIFDYATYAGIAGIGTFIVTIPLANAFSHGPFKKITNAFVKGLDTLKIPKGAQENIVNTTNLMHGGNFMLIFVGLAEHFKKPIVASLNKKLGDPTDPRVVEETPKLTVLSLVQGRALAWLSVFTGFTTAKFLLGNKFEKGLDYAGTSLAKILKQPAILKNGEHSAAYKWGHTGALDVLATASASTILYTSSHFFEKNKSKSTSENLNSTTPGTRLHEVKHISKLEKHIKSIET